MWHTEPFIHVCICHVFEAQQTHRDDASYLSITWDLPWIPIANGYLSEIILRGFTSWLSLKASRIRFLEFRVTL